MYEWCVYGERRRFQVNEILTDNLEMDISYTARVSTSIHSLSLCLQISVWRSKVTAHNCLLPFRLMRTFTYTHIPYRPILYSRIWIMSVHQSKIDFYFYPLGSMIFFLSFSPCHYVCACIVFQRAMQHVSIQIRPVCDIITFMMFVMVFQMLHPLQFQRLPYCSLLNVYFIELFV